MVRQLMQPRWLESFAILTLSLCFASTTKGDLVLNVSGTTGNNIISWAASGEIFPASGGTTLNSNLFRYPSTGWSFMPAAGTGDDLVKGNQFNNPASGSLKYIIGGVDHPVTLTFFDVYDAGNSIEPFGISTDYPNYLAGDKIELVGSGTFTLSAGTFDSVFSVGSYTRTADGGSFITTVTAVPEPSGFLMGTLLTCGLAFRRKRSRPLMP